MRALLASFLLALALGCASAPAPAGTFEAPPPSVRLTPRFVFEGQAVRVSCYHPDPDPWHRIRLEVYGLKSMDVAHESKLNTMLIERAECGQWMVTCFRYDARTGKGTRLEAQLDVKGRCDGQGTKGSR